jgi:hypothetical protein
MPGAHRDTKCPLCRDIKELGQPTRPAAIIVLNNQQKREQPRACPRCGGETLGLVTRLGELMCAGCAEDLDDA